MKEITSTQLRELYEKHTTKEMSKQLGCSRATIYKLLRAAGIPLKNPETANRFKVIEG